MDIDEYGEDKDFRRGVIQAVDKLNQIAISSEDRLNTFTPRRIKQNVQPTPSIGELVVWNSTGDGKLYIVYRDVDLGVIKAELT